MIVTLHLGELVFGAGEIVSVEAKQTVDPIYGRLPEGKLAVQLCTAIPLSPQKEEQLTLLVNGITVLTMFVKECVKTGSDRYRLLAKPRTEYLQTEFIGKIYENHQVFQVLPDIFGEQADRMDAEQIYFESAIGYIPPGTRGTALEQLVFAAGGMIICGTAGDLAFKKPLQEGGIPLREEMLLPIQSQRFLPYYTRYELVAHQYEKENVEKVAMDKEYVNGTPATVTFRNPHWSYYTGDEFEGEIIEEGSNYVKMYHKGIMVIYGKPWVDRPQYHTLPGVGSEDPWYSHVLTVRDRTLIGPHNVESRLQELKTLGQLRCQRKINCLQTSMGLAARPGDRVTLPDGTWGIVTGETLMLTQNQLLQELTVIC